MEKYTTEYFIEKFSKIPENEIGEGSINSHCILWHFGVRQYREEEITPELKEFGKIVGAKPEYVWKFWGDIYSINDSFPGKTPKERILKELNRIKDLPLTKWQRLWRKLKSFF